MSARFGAFLFTSQFDGMDETLVLDAALRYADRAEAVGFDDLWVDEHHFIPWGVNPSALTMAAFLLGRTSRLRVGTAVVLLPQLPPVFVAEQAALLDHLSGGRLDLGIGRGGPVVDLPVAGRRFEHWSAGYWPAVDLLLSAWDGSVHADTELYRFPAVRPKPAPRTAPRPPLFTASVSESSIDQAARRGIPLLLFLHESDDSRAHAVRRWAEVAAEHGHPTEHPGHAFAVIGHVTERQATSPTIGENLMSFFTSSSADYQWLPQALTDAGPDGPGHRPEQMRTFVEQILAQHPIGDAGTCADRLVTTIEISGIDRVLIMLEAAADPDEVLRNVTAFGEQVLPSVRQRLAGGIAHGSHAVADSQQTGTAARARMINGNSG